LRIWAVISSPIAVAGTKIAMPLYLPTPLPFDEQDSILRFILSFFLSTAENPPQMYFIW
jgi:hypothetical protein